MALKGAALVAFGISIVALAGPGFAQPKGPSPVTSARPISGGGIVRPPGVASAKAASIEVFYKPSVKGVDTTVQPTKEAATLGCLFQNDERNAYSITMWSGKAFCGRKNVAPYPVGVECPGGYTLVSDDKLHAGVKATFGQTDQCLKTGASPALAGSYVPAACARGVLASGHVLTIGPGPDKCLKDVVTLFVHLPGGNPTTIAGGATQAMVDARTVTCPSNAALIQEGEAVYCKRVP